MNLPKITLASSSPRRRELLEQVGIPYVAITPDVVEEDVAHENNVSDLVDVAVLRARAKATASPVMVGTKGVLAADTIVFRDGTMFEKPDDRNDARRMLQALAGNTHFVVTALALKNQAGYLVCERKVRTQVRFAPLSSDEVECYLDSQEWQGVAGGYRIQEQAAIFVEYIAGSYSNVVGLPIQTVYSMVRQFLTVT